LRPRRVLTTCVTLGVLAWVSQAGAHAFPTTDAFPVASCGPNIDIDFVGTWNSTIKVEAREAINEWERFSQFDGGRKVKIREDPPPGWADSVVSIEWDDNLFSDATSLCFGATGSFIRLNTQYNDVNEVEAMRDAVTMRWDTSSIPTTPAPGTHSGRGAKVPR
jgi:hypothetical protein